MPSSSLADSKVSWLQAALGSTKTNLTDLEWDYFLANSGLSTGSKWSLSDHKMAFFRTALGLAPTTGISITDAERAWWYSSGATDASYSDRQKDFYDNLLGIGPSIRQQKYTPAPGAAGTSQVVNFDASVLAGTVLIACIYEYPIAGGAVTGVAGCGATWAQAARTANGPGNIALSIWVGVGATTGTAITVTSSANQQNEVHLSEFRGLAGTIVGINNSTNTAVVPLTSGARTATGLKNLMFGGFCTNIQPAITWTSTPSGWTPLVASPDMFLGYKVVNSLDSHAYKGNANPVSNYVGAIVEIAAGTVSTDTYTSSYGASY